MNLEGGIRVDLTLDPRGVRQATVQSDRPVNVARVLVGLGPAQVCETVPLLFSVCAMAQASAAARACRQALGAPPQPATDLARDLLVQAEMLREHAMRIILDWPRYLGHEPNWAIARPLHGLIAALTEALFPGGAPFRSTPRPAPAPINAGDRLRALDTHLGQHIFGEPPDRFHRRHDLDSLRQWIGETPTPAAGVLAIVLERNWSAAGRTDCPALPEQTAPVIARRLFAPQAEHWVAQPEWNGEPAETSAFTRQGRHPLVRDLLERFGSGLLTRLSARLLELAGLPARLRELDRRRTAAPAADPQSTPCPPGCGYAEVETARGRLCHAVQVAGGVLQQIHILAPTEWNFHPRGVVAQGLNSLANASESDIRLQAGLLIETIDPCAGYQLCIHHA